MRSLLVAAAFVSAAISPASRAVAQGTAPLEVLPNYAASPDPHATPNLHPYRHPAFAAYAARDPGLVPDPHASTISGLRAYRTTGTPAVSGYLEPSEGVVGECGSKYYAAVPLDSGTVAGFTGWLIYGPSQKRHLAIVPGTEGLEFRKGRIRASSFVFDSKHATASTHRVDSWSCRANGFRLVESQVVTAP